MRAVLGRGGRGRIDSEKDGKMAEELDHIPMPEPAVKLIEKTSPAEIKN